MAAHQPKVTVSHSATKTPERPSSLHSRRCRLHPSDTRMVQSDKRPLKSLSQSKIHRVLCYEDLPAIATNENLSLNFAYRREYSFTDAVHATDSGNSSSSSDFSIPDSSITFGDSFMRQSHWLQAEPDFTKYIPINNPCSLEVPHLLHNDKYSDEWETAQETLVQSRKCPLSCSQSDTVLSTPKKQKKKRKKKHSLKRLFSCTSGIKSPDKQMQPVSQVKRKGSPMASHSSHTAQERVYDSSPRPKLTDPRFDYKLNLDYIKVACNSTPQLSAALYAQLPENMNFQLCKMKTDLAVSAMLQFFYPYSNIRSMWMKDLQSHIIDTLQDGNLHPKFTKLVYLRRFDALLIVSADAGVLLRHRHLALLHTLATVLQVSTHRLLVLTRPAPKQIIISPEYPGTLIV